MQGTEFSMWFFFVLQVQSSLVSVCIYFFCFKASLISLNSFSHSSTTVHCSSPTMAPIWIRSLLWPSNETSWRAFSRTTQGEAHSHIAHRCMHERYFWVSYEKKKVEESQATGFLETQVHGKYEAACKAVQTCPPFPSDRLFLSYALILWSQFDKLGRLQISSWLN